MSSSSSALRFSQSVNTSGDLVWWRQANVIWQNVGNVKIQAGAFMQGIILCFTDVAIETGAREWCYHGTDRCPSEGDCHSDWYV
jgi:hypothetical protein